MFLPICNFLIWLNFVTQIHPLTQSNLSNTDTEGTKRSIRIETTTVFLLTSCAIYQNLENGPMTSRDSCLLCFLSNMARGFENICEIFLN